MKRVNILFTLLLCLSHLTWAQGSGEGYNPENPGDPNVYYTLLLEASPRMGGTVSPTSKQLGFGESVYCSASAKTGYTFSRWMIGDSVVSTDSYFTFTMSDHDEVLTAYFDYTGYDPSNPGDPFIDGYRHKVTLYANPSIGGYFNSSSFYMTEGETTRVYAYPRDGYRFASWKKNGIIVSTTNPMPITMGQEDLSYVATFVYDPENPGEPAPNMFNQATGELVIDDFKSGYLYEAIRTAIGGSENYDLIQSVKIVGVMNEDDLGFTYRLTNCSNIDICRTSGYSEIPSYMFEGMSSLTSIALPASINTFGNNVFSGCSNLSEIVCYAMTPPTVSVSTFANMADGVVVKVPSSSMSLYQQASIWSVFSFLPLDIETCSITVNLPADASDGRYKNAILELKNITSGNSSKYLITNRTSYTFANNIRESQYSIYVKNNSAEILGSIEEVDIDSTSITLTFDSLRQPHTISIRVTTPDGEDVTSSVIVKWTNNGQYFSSEKTLPGILEGTSLLAYIELPQSLGILYATPSNISHVVTSGNNVINVSLQPLLKKTISGVLLDSINLQPIYGAVVGASQLLNGKHHSSTNVKVATDGHFSLEVFDVPTVLTASASNYYSKTTSNVDTILLAPITGLSINVSFTYQHTGSVISDTLISQGYSDRENVYYSVYNVTTGQEVSNLTQHPEQIVLTEGVSPMDVLQITAHSRNNSFADVMVETTIMNQATSIVVPIVELGTLHAQYNSTGNNSVCGVLYDGNGVFVQTSKYKGQELSMSQLPDGIYTLVTMGDSPFFKSVHRLSELSASGLVENIDYIRDTVTIQSGIISDLLIVDVPFFDESKFYYTGKNTLFSVNKSHVTVGNYVTIRTKVDFLPQYADQISGVKLVVDIPDGCRFVENSVLAGSGLPTYNEAGQKITIDLTEIGDVVRFCINPISSGVYYPSATIQFQLGNREIIQPIGSAYFTADAFNLVVPDKTAFTSVAIGGSSFPNSIIRVFDNNMLVADARSIANGDWACKIDLYKPYSKSYHSIFAEIVAPDGQVYTTDTKLLEYDKNYAVPSKVKMLYNNQTIVFDMLERAVSAKSYSYNPSVNDFTFVGSFTKNDSSVVKNVEFVVLASDGTIRRHRAEYYGAKNAWTVHATYGNSSQIPTNVVMDYIHTANSPILDESRENDLMDIVQTMLNEIESIYNNAQYNLINEGDSSILFSVSTDSTHTEYYQLVQENYKDYIADTTQYDFFRIVNDTMNCYVLFSSDNQTVILDCDEQSAYSITYSPATSNHGQRSILPIILSTAYGAGVSVYEYYLRLQEISDWYSTIEMEQKQWEKERKRLEQMLYVTCSDGSMKISSSQMPSCKQSYEDWVEIKEQYFEVFRRKVQQEQDFIRALCTAKGLFSVGTSLILGGAGKLLGAWMGCSNLANNISTAVTETAGQAASYFVGDLMESGVSSKKSISDWHTKNSKTLTNDYVKVVEYIRSCYQECQKEDDEEDEDEHTKDVTITWITPGIQPAIDPSGYLYEGVSSNRVEGATATAYYKEYVEDMYGDIIEKVVLWDASEFAQENPLFTDAEGKYAWDVPQGLWQVKFEKEGYETTFSEWLPVPPPQLDVNIAMKQYRQPEVIAAHAYEQGVEVEFDKYMQPALLNTDNIVIMQNEQQITGKVELLDETMAYKDSSVTYATRARFVPEQPLAKQPITLIVANRVKSYADVRMQDTYQQIFDVEQEITSLAITPSTIQVPYNGTKIVTITAFPAEAAKGKTIAIKVGSTMIASTDVTSCVFDNNGQAQITLTGELLGTTSLSVSISNTHLTASAMVYVQNAEDILAMVATPEASIPSGSIVEQGTLLTLSCETPDATIYYTIDGSDPTLSDRIPYETPIVINENVTIQAVAEAPNMNHSLIAAFTYTVQTTDQLINIPSDNNSTWKKIIRNNRLWIFHDGIWYDAFGNRILTHWN